MGVSQPRRERGRTLIERDPDQLVWVLLARESREAGAEGDEQVNYQLGDLREFVAGIGGRVEREVPESNVSSFKRRRVMLPDGTYGYRVVRPDWEATMTALRRGEANALAGVDIDRLTRDPRILEDLIDAVELYGIYVASMTGNIDLSTDAGISAARGLVNQRNTESRNTSRRVSDGKRRAAARGQHNGGRMRPFGWRKDRVTINKREAARRASSAPVTNPPSPQQPQTGSKTLASRCRNRRRTRPRRRTPPGGPPSLRRGGTSCCEIIPIGWETVTACPAMSARRRTSPGSPASGPTFNVSLTRQRRTSNSSRTSPTGLLTCCPTH